jgi:hypothetical protein
VSIDATPAAYSQVREAGTKPKEYDDVRRMMVIRDLLLHDHCTDHVWASAEVDGPIEHYGNDGHTGMHLPPTQLHGIGAYL